MWRTSQERISQGMAAAEKEIWHNGRGDNYCRIHHFLPARRTLRQPAPHGLLRHVHRVAFPDAGNRAVDPCFYRPARRTATTSAGQLSAVAVQETAVLRMQRD